MTLLLSLLACTPSAPESPRDDAPPPAPAPAPEPTAPPSPPVDSALATADTAAFDGSATRSPYIRRTGPPPRHLLLVSTDTTRFDHLDANGYAVRSTSPRLAALFAEGLHLTAHRSCSAWTMASFLCVLTGRDQVDLGLWPDNNNHGAGVPPLDAPLPSLAQRLSDEGFQTGLVYANSFLSSKFGMNTGHDTEQRAGRAPETTDHAIERLDELALGGDRWFLHVHYNDPHTPYDADASWHDPGTGCPLADPSTKEGFRELEAAYPDADPAEQAACVEHVRMLYDAGIREADHHIGRLLDHLDTTGQRDETLIVFLTDHGEAFMEHGQWEHGFGMFQGLSRSTAAFVHPARIAPATHDGLTTHVDLRPTILTALDLDLDPDGTGTVVGEAPVDLVEGLVYRNELTVQSVTTPTHTLAYHWDGALHLYDDVADPSHTTDLWDPADATSQQMWGLLAPSVDALAARVTDGSVPQGRPDASR